MNWDEKAEDHASAHHTYEHTSVSENLFAQGMFVKGTEWQRDQLRTDEAVERVAEGIHDADCACGDLTNPQFEGQEGSEHYREIARAAITALLGPDHTTHHEGCGCP